MVAHTLKPSSWEANAGGSLSIQGQPSLLSELQNSQNHLETLPQKERKKKMREGGCVCNWGHYPIYVLLPNMSKALL